MRRSGTVPSLKRGEFEIQEKIIIKNGIDKVPPPVNKSFDRKYPSNEGHVAPRGSSTYAKIIAGVTSVTARHISTQCLKFCG